MRSLSANRTTKKCSVEITLLIYFWNLRPGSLFNLITEGTKKVETGEASRFKLEPQFEAKSDSKPADSLAWTFMHPLNISTFESNIS